jgi:hypothetical protein
MIDVNKFIEELGGLVDRFTNTAYAAGGFIAGLLTTWVI